MSGSRKQGTKREKILTTILFFLNLAVNVFMADKQGNASFVYFLLSTELRRRKTLLIRTITFHPLSLSTKVVSYLCVFYLCLKGRILHTWCSGRQGGPAHLSGSRGGGKLICSKYLFICPHQAATGSRHLSCEYHTLSVRGLRGTQVMGPGDQDN